MNRHLRDLREGASVLASREFWHAFRSYWSSEAVSARMDEWVHRMRKNTGQQPDESVERRRRERAGKTPD